MKHLSRIDQHIADLHGQTIVVTGANSGIGFYATRYFARQGATVVMACRSIQRAEAARADILKEVAEARIDIIRYDQASFRAIDAFLDTLQSRYPRIHALVLNAGIFHPAAHATTDEGLPLTVGTNYIGLYYLLKKGMRYFDQGNPPTRIVFVSSLVADTHPIYAFDKLSKDQGSPLAQYAYSKTAIDKLFHVLANGMNLADFPERKNVCFALTHPGITNTDIVKSYPPGFQKAAHFVMSMISHHPEKASLGIVYCAGAPYVYNGSVFVPWGPFGISGKPIKSHLARHIAKGSGQFVYETGKLVAAVERGEFKCSK